jgi:hypothetical protein
MTAKDDLNTILTEGVSTDIFKADQALAIVSAIGEHADAVNESTFSNTFVTLQAYGIEQFVLAVTRLYDRIGGYELRNVPAALRFVEANAPSLTIEQPINLKREMQRIGAWTGAMDQLAGADLTAAVCAQLQPLVPTLNTYPALVALKAIRDKRLAHAENIPGTSIPRTTWEEAEKLLIPAKNIGAVLAQAYTSTAYTDEDGRYIADSDASRAAISVQRLLRKVGITPAVAHEFDNP